MSVIDIHAHIAPHFLHDRGDPRAAIPGLDLASAIRGLKYEHGVGERLANMDRLGIDVQVLSTQGQLYCADQDPAAALTLHRSCNEYVHELVSARPDRFAGLAIIPMQDVELAVGERPGPGPNWDSRA